MAISIILLLAVGLSMDAFAVSVTNGMCYKMPVVKNAACSGLAFGIFQGAMPLIGYFAGQSFSGLIEKYDHWLALILLCVIGVKMIVEALKDLKLPQGRPDVKTFSVRVLIFQAIATSIDAMAVGVGLGVMKVPLFLAVGLIAAITFIFSFAGVFIGKKFGRFLKEKAEIFGGIILIIIGLRIFMEHTGIISLIFRR